MSRITRALKKEVGLWAWLFKDVPRTVGLTNLNRAGRILLCLVLFVAFGVAACVVVPFGVVLRALFVDESRPCGDGSSMTNGPEENAGEAFRPTMEAPDDLVKRPECPAKDGGE